MRKYRLLEKRDVGQVERLWEKTKVPVNEVTHPVIVCEDDGDIIGMIARAPHKYVFAEPLLVDPERGSAFVYMRLIEAWENYLRACGVDKYMFRIHRNHPAYTAHRRTLKKAEQTTKVGDPIAGFQYYMRKVP
jgi:hypothetical protein